MKAAVFDRYGGNEVVEIRDLPEPAAGPGEVLVRVRAAGVNPVDWKVREGQAKILTGSKFPKVLGCECAGESVATGDRVILYAGVRRLGAYAEYACADEAAVYSAPRGISFEQAACIPIAGLTALQALRDHGKLSSGKRLLVNGAAGGVGHFAVQIAKVLGAGVTAVCSGAKADFVKSLGADRVIDYRERDFTKDRDRYDLVFDAVSKRSFAECRRILMPKGRYVNTLPDRTILYQIITTLLPGKKARNMWVRPNRADMEWLRQRIEAGRIRVVIDRVFPLEQVREAFAYSESGRARGKIALTIG